jgi:amino acid adenylation domain-containing protein
MTSEPVHHLFRAASRRFPDHAAVSWESGSITYRQLAAEVDRLTARLCQAGARQGELVNVLAGGAADTIAAILAVLEAGCAFVPLDRHSPAARLEAVAAEAGARWWLVHPQHLAAVEELLREQQREAGILLLGEEPAAAGEPLRAAAADPPPARDPLGPDDLCYVYFTSGSTGRPKGIAGRLKAIDHFIRWEIDTFGFGEGVRVSQLTSPGFDAFLRDAFVPLAVGGTVCAPASRDTLLDGARLVEWIDRERLNLVHCTPSLLRVILGQELDPTRFGALTHLLLAGEPLLAADVRRWMDVFGQRVQLVNLYGPSETTMIKLYHPVTPEDCDSPSIPIGRPIRGARAIVVDDRGEPCPPGKLGEIYIRTPFRSLGYLNDPELTRQAFIPNPWSDLPDDLIYRTGDLGRVRPDGCFEYIGRRDQQVKVRGVRVEIAPIEDQLRSHPAVSDLAVVDRTDVQGNKYLCAYLVLGEPCETAEIGDFLRRRLPEAMVPSAFVVMAGLPRTLSGKVDRRALPDPGRLEAQVARPYVAPRTPVEEQVCGLFAELLGLPRAGIDDAFFELGGHSLLATLLLARIRAAFGVEVPLHEIFRAPTVRGLALAVTRLQAEAQDEAELEEMLSEVERQGAGARLAAALPERE